MKKSTLLLVSTVGAVFLSAAVQAAGTNAPATTCPLSPTWLNGVEVTPGIGLMLTPHSQPLQQDTFLYMLRFGEDLNKYFSLEEGFLHGRLFDRNGAKPANPYGESDLYGAWLDTVFHFTRWDRFDPFLSAGVGKLWATDRALPGYKRQEITPRLGAGAMYHLTDNLSLRAGATLLQESSRVRQSPAHRDNTFAIFDAGLVYTFGGSKPVAPAPAIAPEAPKPAPSLDALVKEVDAFHATPKAPLPEDLLLVTLEMNFAYDVSVIDSKYYSQLDAIATVLMNHPEASALIEGHADQKTKSVKEYNQKLSEDRARATVQYLVSRGINPARLKAVGYGFTRPKVKPDLVNGNPENRRVEVYINNVGGTQAATAEYQKNLLKKK